jgi:hypothetical protein
MKTLISHKPLGKMLGNIRISKTPDKKNDLFVVWEDLNTLNQYVTQITSLDGKSYQNIDGMRPSLDDNTLVYIDQTTGQLLTRECQIV